MRLISWKLARIPLFYLILGSVWILFSDHILQYFTETFLDFRYFQTIKGIGFVVITTILLYILIYWQYSELLTINIQLADKERTLKNLFNNLPGMVYRCQNDKNFTILFVSEACTEITGYTPQEFTSQISSFAKIIHLDDLPHVYESVNQSIQNQSHFETTYRLLKRTGEIVWVWEKGSGVYDHQGQFLYLEGIVMDITEHIKDKEIKEELQKQFYQAQKMESIGRFSSGIAHDFNNLLTVIEGHTSLLLNDLSDNRHRCIIEKIQKASSSASSLIRQLLVFSRNHDTQVKTIDLNHTLDSMHNMISRVMKSNIELVLRTSDEATPIQIDPTQLEQILLNLIVNAQDAMEHGGTLTIETSIETIKEGSTFSNRPTTSRSYVLLKVSDTGIGMSLETQERIFEPFFTTKEPDRGTGLGLSTVYGIVNQAAGTISVKSKPGEGTMFRLYFPKAE